MGRQREGRLRLLVRHTPGSSPNLPVPISNYGKNQPDFKQMLQRCGDQCDACLLKQTVAILPTTLPNGRSRHTVKVFYQVQVAVREVFHEAQDS
jgi:hypothetical protein